MNDSLTISDYYSESC